MRIYPYLRASTEEQDSKRAYEYMKAFAVNQRVALSTPFFENESGAKLKRPELFKLISVAEKGDCILVEQVDRLSRLNHEDWEKLKSILAEKEISVVSQDLPTSWQFLHADIDHSLTSTILRGLNSMILDVLASVAHKDYEDRRRRMFEGIEKAKKSGKYKGRAQDAKKRSSVKKLLQAGMTWDEVQHAVKCGRSMIATVSKELKEENKFCDQQFLFKK